MKTVTILLTHSPKIGSWLIRKKTKSEFSHTAIYFPNGRVLEAGFKNGVAFTTLPKFISHHSFVIAIHIDTNRADKLYRAGQAEEGKDYDLTAIFGMLANRDWQEDDQWFCSELIAFILKVAGLYLEEIALLDPHAVTPRDIWLLLRRKGIVEVLKGEIGRAHV